MYCDDANQHFQTIKAAPHSDAASNTLTLPNVGTVFSTTDGTQTLTNKTLTSPKIGTAILDTSGNELINLTATGSAVNEITLANAASGNAPTITASGETNVSLNLVPKGTGTLQGNGAALKIAGKETMWIPAAARCSISRRFRETPLSAFTVKEFWYCRRPSEVTIAAHWLLSHAFSQRDGLKSAGLSGWSRARVARGRS